MNLTKSERLATLLSGALIADWLIPLLPAPIAALLTVVLFGGVLIGAQELFAWVKRGQDDCDGCGDDDLPGGAA